MLEPTDRQIRKTFTEHGLEAYKKIPLERSYALDDHATLMLASVAKSIHELAAEMGSGSFRREDVTAALEQLIACGESLLVQSRPGPEPEPPEPWKDPVTGLVANNPWAPATPNLDDAMLITKRDPQLAEYLKAVANGVTYGFLAKLQDEAAARERLRKLEYSARQHAKNPWANGGGMEERSAFVRAHGQETSDFYKHEARPVRVESMSGSDVIRAAVRKSSPRLLATIDRASAILRQWLEGDAKALEATRKASAAQAEAVLQQLGQVRRLPGLP